MSGTFVIIPNFCETPVKLKRTFVCKTKITKKKQNNFFLFKDGEYLTRL